MPALLRHARLAYSSSMRTALDAAGYDDIPKNGLYVIGGLAREIGAHPLSQLIEELQLSKTGRRPARRHPGHTRIPEPGG